MDSIAGVEDQSYMDVNEDNKSYSKRVNPFNTQQRKCDKNRRQIKKARIIVRNISYTAKEDVLLKHFGQWGKIAELNLLKRPDGNLVGCAFIQYTSVNQASKAILRGNKKKFLGRSIYIDWALGKDDYINTRKVKKAAYSDNIKHEIEPKVEGEKDVFIKEEDKDKDSEKEKKGINGNGNEDTESENEKDSTSWSSYENKQKLKTKIERLDKAKHKSNDVSNGCTLFLKNVPFDAEDSDLRKVFRKFGPLYYAIINREAISGHSKGTAFIKFKSKESADLCLQGAGELTLMDQMLEPYPALSREELQNQDKINGNKNVKKDSRNLYLAREGLIMANSKSAEGVSASDMTKRHKLEQIKTQVLKNLNRFVSRNRLSIHNLPLNYDNEKLKQMVVAHTGFRTHECRVMRENKITPEHPKGRSKGFGFMSFNTHQDALTALRKLNNNPSIFGVQHRPIVAFSIEDRAVEKIKEKRKQKSKVNNPTFQEKLKRTKEIKGLSKQGKPTKKFDMNQDGDKAKLKKHIQKLENSRATKEVKKLNNFPVDELDNFVGTAAKPGLNIRMRSNKKIIEQAKDHRQRTKESKRKEKAKKIRQMHLTERKAIDRPKQGKKMERDDLEHLVNKYKRIFDSQADVGDINDNLIHAIQRERKKWYIE